MKGKILAPYLRLAHAACLMMILGVVCVVPVQAASFGGRAYSAFVNVPGSGAGAVYITDTGALASSGGWEGAGALSVSVPIVLSANVPVACTSGDRYQDLGDKSNSSSSLADIAVLSGSPAALSASFVRTETEATPTAGRGSVEINGLTFGGTPIVVTGQANQRVDILGVATLIINEQTTTSNGTSRTVTVNALHLILAGGGEVIVSSATSSITY